MADLSSQPTLVQTVYTWYRGNQLFVNRRYQRKLVWTLEEKQKLIDSILRKYPVPAILLAEKDERYEIIDGLQRLHAIMSFIEGAFSTVDGRHFNLSFFPAAKSLAESGVFQPKLESDWLNDAECSAVLNYSMAASIMRNASPEEINDVFDRINTFGHRLSEQERRQSGVQSKFADTVRDLASVFRGDASRQILPLYDMPSISIDLPKMRHGYQVRADEVFWVSHGILRSTDLRDSGDEQCIADIIACIVGQDLIERSKTALDNIYDSHHSEYGRISAALELYGEERVCDEIKFCAGELEKICELNNPVRLKQIMFDKPTSNPFPSKFANLLMALHELIVQESMEIRDYSGIRVSLQGIEKKMDAGQKGASPDARRLNIDAVKGVIRRHFVVSPKISSQIYSDHKVVDIETDIRRSEAERSSFELKQGLMPLSEYDDDMRPMLNKVVNTLCALANNGPQFGGKLLIGVADTETDADRVAKLYDISPKKIADRYVVGVNREARRLGKSAEEYLQGIRVHISESALSEPLKGSVLACIDYHSYFGLGVIL